MCGCCSRVLDDLVKNDKTQEAREGGYIEKKTKCREEREERLVLPWTSFISESRKEPPDPSLDSSCPRRPRPQTICLHYFVQYQETPDGSHGYYCVDGFAGIRAFPTTLSVQ